MTRTLRILAVAACAALSVPEPATAAEPPADAASAADRETARSLMKTGDEKLRAGDFAGALEDFRTADRLVRLPSTRFAVGRAQGEMGLLLEARDTLLSVRRMPAEADEPVVVTEAREQAAELAQRIAERVPSLKVDTKGLAHGVEPRIVIDGREVAADLASVARKMNPGAHRIVATAPGYVPLEQTVELEEREERTLTLEFVADGTATAAEHVAAPTEAPSETPPGTPVGELPAEETSEGVSPMVWVGFGLAAAGVVAGLIAGGIAMARVGELEDACPEHRCPRESAGDDYDAAYAAANASTAGFVVAGVGVAVGLIGLALPGSSAEPEAGETGSRVRPVVGVGSLSLEGTF